VLPPFRESVPTARSGPRISSEGAVIRQGRAVILVGVLAMACAAAATSCKEPRQVAQPQEQQEGATRTQSITTRANAGNLPGSNPAVNPMPSGAGGISASAEDLPATPEPQCLLSLTLESMLLDCSFPTCPREELALIVAAQEISLRRDATAWRITGLRPTPPQSIESNLTLSRLGPNHWIVQLGQQKEAAGTCSAAGKDVLVQAPAHAIVKVSAVAVRSILADD